jgi:hypothetical protein
MPDTVSPTPLTPTAEIIETLREDAMHPDDEGQVITYDSTLIEAADRLASLEQRIAAVTAIPSRTMFDADHPGYGHAVAYNEALMDFRKALGLPFKSDTDTRDGKQ